MNKIASEPYVFQGKTYQIETFRSDTGTTVFATLDGKRVSPYSYSADDDLAHDYNFYTGQQAIDHLKEFAKGDIHGRQ